MNKRREATEKIILRDIKLITGNDKHNMTLYENLLKRMSDKEFDEFMKELRDSKTSLQIIVEPTSQLEKKMTVNYLLDIGDRMKVKVFHKITKVYKDGSTYTSRIELPILNLPFKRLRQTLVSGLNVSKNSRTNLDPITGQVKGDNKTTSLSKPEAELLSHFGLEKTLNELERMRGGDIGLMKALSRSLYINGGATQKQLELFSTGVKSTKALKAYFNAAFLKLITR